MKTNVFQGTKINKEARCEIQTEASKLAFSIACYDKHVARALDLLDGHKQAKRLLERVFIEDNFDEPLTLANQHVRSALGMAVMLAGCEAAEHDRLLQDGTSQARLLTTISDLGYTAYTGGELNFTGVRGHYDYVTRKAGLEGLGLLDFAMVHPKTEFIPVDVSLHFHGLVRSFDPKFERKKAEAMASRNKLLNKEGLQVVDIRAKASPVGLSDLAGLLYYVSKLSCGTKASGQNDARSSNAFWKWTVALRGLEVLSHFEALESLRGVGEFGKSLRHESKQHFQRLLGVERLPRGLTIDHDKLTCEWGRVYDALGMTDLAPFTVR